MIGNTRELRSLLLGDLSKLRSGEIPRAEARARSAIVRNVLDTMRIEIACQSMQISNLPPVSFDDTGYMKIAAE